MSDDESRDGGRGRRSFLRASAALGAMGLLAGCNTLEASTGASRGAQGDSNRAIHRMGNSWLTFGDRDQWGVRCNRLTNEFEIAWDPLGSGIRKNIKIQPDTHTDKGDIHIDDSIIIRNEAEVSDGDPTDPSYTFGNQNNTGFWRDGSGIVGVTTNGKVAARFDNGTTRIEGDITTNDDDPTTIWDGDSAHSPNLPASSATVSGDGSTTSFSLPHSLDVAPEAAVVTPTSPDAADAFWVSEKSADAVEITYKSAPPAGSDNLTYDLVVSL